VTSLHSSKESYGTSLQEKKKKLVKNNGGGNKRKINGKYPRVVTWKWRRQRDEVKEELIVTSTALVTF